MTRQLVVASPCAEIYRQRRVPHRTLSFFCKKRQVTWSAHGTAMSKLRRLFRGNLRFKKNHTCFFLLVLFFFLIVRCVDRALFCGLTLSHLICDCCFTRRVVMVKVGHPGPPHVVGIGVPWVSLPGSTSVPSNAQAR